LVGKPNPGTKLLKPAPHDGILTKLQNWIFWRLAQNPITVVPKMLGANWIPAIDRLLWQINMNGCDTHAAVLRYIFGRLGASARAQVTISKIETGARTGSVEMLKLISAALKVEVDESWFRVER
jgi:hypothetical protein